MSDPVGGAVVVGGHVGGAVVICEVGDGHQLCHPRLKACHPSSFSLIARTCDVVSGGTPDLEVETTQQNSTELLVLR